MYNVGAAFVISVFTYYAVYRYIFKETEYSHEMISIQVKWQTFYLTYTLLVIWISSMVKKEVSAVFFCFASILSFTIVFLYTF